MKLFQSSRLATSSSLSEGLSEVATFQLYRNWESACALVVMFEVVSFDPLNIGHRRAILPSSGQLFDRHSSLRWSWHETELGSHVGQGFGVIMLRNVSARRRCRE